MEKNEFKVEAGEIGDQDRRPDSLNQLINLALDQKLFKNEMRCLNKLEEIPTSQNLHQLE